MRERHLATIGLAALITMGIPTSSAEPIRRAAIPLDTPPVVSTYASNVEIFRNDTILRAGSVLLYGTDSHFPAQGALIKDNGKYYVWTIRHAITALALREHKMGVYIPFVGSFVEDSRRMTFAFSESVNRDDIVALQLKEQEKARVLALENAGFILPLEFRRELPQINQMVAIPNPEAARYFYYRISDINLNLLALIEETRYQNPPVCQGQSGAPVLYVDETSRKTILTNQVLGAVVAGGDLNPSQIDKYGRLCSHFAVLVQMHNRYGT